jgi:hypothetical protein
MISATIRVASRAIRTSSNCLSLILTEPYWLFSC